jgi:hypothetical protein
MSVKPPYIELIYEWNQPRVDNVGIDILYSHVQIVQQGQEPMRYDKNGNYEADLKVARADGRVISGLQEHESVALFEKLVKAKRDERDRILGANNPESTRKMNAVPFRTLKDDAYQDIKLHPIPDESQRKDYLNSTWASKLSEPDRSAFVEEINNKWKCDSGHF